MINFAAALDDPQPPAVVNPFDLSAVKTGLARYDEEIDRMVSQAAALQVAGEEDNNVAVMMAGTAKKLNRKLEEVRKEYVKAPNEYVKSVNALAKAYQDRLTVIESGLKKKISAYQVKVELERRKQEEADRKAREELQAKVNAEAAALNVEAPVIAPAVAPELPKVTRTEAGTASQRKEWRFEVIDETQVPREYLMVDHAKIRQAVKAGVREIPGVNIFEESITVIRS